MPVVGLLDEGVEVPRGRVVFVLHVLLHLIPMFALTIQNIFSIETFLVTHRRFYSHSFG